MMELNTDGQELLPPSAFLLPDLPAASVTGDFQNIRNEETEIVSSDLFHTIEKLKQENSDLQQTNGKLSSELRYLRTYIGTLPATAIGTVDRQIQQTEIEGVEDDKLQMERVTAHLEVRIRSLEEVIRIQEKCLCTSEDDGASCSKRLMDSAQLNHLENLLSGWRSHVVRLLMDSETQKAELKQAEMKLLRQAAMLCDLERKSQTDRKALALKLQASQAAMKSEQERFKLVNKQLISIQEEHTGHQQTQSVWESEVVGGLTKVAAQLKQLMHAFHSPSGSSSEISHRIGQLDRRLQFAANRLPLIRNRLNLKSYSKPTDLSLSGVQNLPYVRSDCIVDVHECCLEIERLKIERDSCLNKLEQYDRSFEERARQNRIQVQSELTNMNEALIAAEASLKLKDEELKKAESNIAYLQHALEECRITKDDDRRRFETDITHLQAQLERAKDEIRRSQKLLCDELQLKRENTKTNMNVDKISNKLSEQWSSSKSRDIDHLNSNPRSTSPYISQKQNSVNFEHPDIVAASLQQLVQMAACLNSSDSSSDEGDGALK